MIEQVTAWQWSGPGKVHDNAVLHARTRARELVREDALRGPAIRDAAWAEYCEKLNDERAGLVDRLAPLKESLAGEIKKSKRCATYTLNNALWRGSRRLPFLRRIGRVAGPPPRSVVL